MVLIGPLAAALIPAGISAAASIFGGERANRQNLKEAERNRGFQKEMRNTQWQAAVSDMRAAGINPALAYQSGPNAAPGGGQARVSDSVTPGISSGIQAAMLKNQLELLREQVNTQKAITVKTYAEGETAGQNARMGSFRLGQYFDPRTGRMTPKMIELLRSEHAGAIASNSRSVTELERLRLTLPEQRAIANIFETAGSGAKGLEMIRPLILAILRGR